jgi:hypothetical protein
VDPINALVSAPAAGARGVVVMTVPASGGEGGDIVLAWVISLAKRECVWKYKREGTYHHNKL